MVPPVGVPDQSGCKLPNGEWGGNLTGEVLEWPNRRDWKSRVPFMRNHGFESHPLRHFCPAGQRLFVPQGQGSLSRRAAAFLSRPGRGLRHHSILGDASRQSLQGNHTGLPLQEKRRGRLMCLIKGLGSLAGPPRQVGAIPMAIGTRAGGWAKVPAANDVDKAAGFRVRPSGPGLLC